TVTPGVAFSDDLLDGARNNFVCAVTAGAGLAGVAAADVSTGELRLTLTPLDELEPVLARLAPREIVLPSNAPAIRLPAERGAEGALVTEREEWEFDAAL